MIKLIQEEISGCPDCPYVREFEKLEKIQCSKLGQDICKNTISALMEMRNTFLPECPLETKNER